LARHYLDHASTTPLRPEARAAMVDWAEAGVTADPGRVHHEGRLVRARLEEAREQVAAFLQVRPRQVVFTSGGTEAVNTAVWGATRVDPGPVACSAVEHSAARDASRRSGPVVPIAVDGHGRIEPGAVEESIRQCRALYGRIPAMVHCQWANHEVGTIQPVAEVVARCAGLGIRTHVDAVAAAGHVPLDISRLGADLVSISSHKFGGPTGIGALIVRRGLRIEPFMVGGEQERARRAGLEHVVGAIGFGAAAAALTAPEVLTDEQANARRRTDRVQQATRETAGVHPYGDPVHRLPHIVCLGVDGVEAEPVLLGLDQSGIAVHSGSSCSSEALEPSPVLEAMGVDGERSLRISVGWSTTDEDIDAFLTAFPRVVDGLRALRS
jgi:cysteine desulfurase